MSHNHQKKAAVINDYSGFGRCSLAVALPILSVMGVQCCPLPTAIFSNHTGFPSYYWTDFTQHMEPYMAEWEKLDLRFNAIATGFLGSEPQIRIVRSFLGRFKTDGTIAVIDPVMGDYGRLYPTYSPALADAMRQLVRYADILTPNLTEACALLGLPYRENFTEAELGQMCADLSGQGPEKIVISGLTLDAHTLGNFVYERGKTPTMLPCEKVGGYRSGTGDVFSAILTGCAIQGAPFETAVRRASDFISKTIRRTIELGIPPTDGICFEEYLADLAKEEPR